MENVSHQTRIEIERDDSEQFVRGFLQATRWLIIVALTLVALFFFADGVTYMGAVFDSGQVENVMHQQLFALVATARYLLALVLEVAAIGFWLITRGKS